MIARLAQQFQGVNAESLKRIRRRSRLKRAAAKHAGSGFGDQFRDGKKLLARLDRARSGHDHDLFAADFNPVRKFDDRTSRTEVAPGQLIGRSNAVNFLHSWHHFDFASVEIMRDPDTAKNGLTRSGGAVDFKPELN